MKICVLGLWHLGTVTAACLSSGGHQVCGLDFDNKVIESLNKGKPPLFEPGLEDLVVKGLERGTLTFTGDIEEAIGEAELIWVTYDTPVNDNDEADVDYVTDRISKLFPYLKSGQDILISSQIPVGTCRLLENNLFQQNPNISVSFSYSPENLRLGKAISVFTEPDRVVIGTRNGGVKEKFTNLLAPFTTNIEWMNVESAEMVKHALNAFLATSVVFINEISSICEKVGADAKEVERGLKSEARIGEKAYLSPGGAFSGGTLARDIIFLSQLGEQKKLPIYLIPSVEVSNENHKKWSRRRLVELLGDIKGKTVAIWGLTYKPGTDTLRRSAAIELINWLLEHGAIIKAHDPKIEILPNSLSSVELCTIPEDALLEADALVVSTEWQTYKEVIRINIFESMKSKIILDANGFLASNIGNFDGITYVTVGKAI